MIKEFFSADEAAEYLSRTVGKVSAAAVHRFVEEGRLPVCFPFTGMLGVYPSTITSMFAPPLRRAYFPAGYLRARSAATATNLNGDVLHPGAVEIAHAGRGFGMIECCSCAAPGPDEAWWIVQWPDEYGPPRYARHAPIEVGADQWLFRFDDLRAFRIPPHLLTPTP